MGLFRAAAYISPLVASRRMSSAIAPLLLSPAQVNEITQSGAKTVSLLDSTWFMPNSPRSAKQEFLGKRIPRSQFLDLDDVASPSELGLKHMMPDRQTFALACGVEFGNLSFHARHHLRHSWNLFGPSGVIMFRTFGHKNSSIIDGGLPRWIDEGLPVETASPIEPQPAEYALPDFDENCIRSYDEIVLNSQFDPAVEPKSEIVLDARPKGRFNGSDPEPRPGLSSGHIPHSFSLTFNLFLEKHTTKDGKEYSTLLPPSGIRKALESAVGPAETDKIIQGERSVVASCGSGMTAGVLWLGLQLLGVKQVGLYDESWTGYAIRPSSLIQK